MAQSQFTPLIDAIMTQTKPWTAQLALDLLPPNNGPKVEIFRGSVIVTPDPGYDHQTAELELTYMLRRAARQAGMWAYLDCNVVSGDDLFIPDFAVHRRSAAGQTYMPIADAVLVGEIVWRDRKKDVIDRPRQYARGGVPFYLLVDFRDRVPSLVLSELVDGAYRPVVTATAGEMFRMAEPFAFEIDPAALLDDEA